MPHYRSAGLDVYLSTSNLDLSTSAAGTAFSRKTSTAVLAQNESALATGDRLKESPVSDEDRVGVLRFIGPKNDLPFLLAYVNSNQVRPADTFTSTIPERSNLGQLGRSIVVDSHRVNPLKHLCRRLDLVTIQGWSRWSSARAIHCTR